MQFYALYLICLLIRFINSIFASGSRRPTTAILAEPFGMGDMVALEPLVAGLLQRGWKVAVLGQQRWRPLFSGVAWVDAPMSWHDLDTYGFVRFAYRLSRTARSDYRGATGVDPRGDIRSIFLLLLLGCKDVITLDHYDGSALKMPPGIAKRAVHASLSMMRWELALQFLQAFGIQECRKTPPQVEHLRRNAHAESRRVGLLPVAPWAGKRWVPERWTAVIRYLLENGFHPTIICGPGQEADAIVAVGSQGRAVLTATSVPMLAESIATCEIIITVDSGPMHLASALNVPLVALFGTGQLPMWAPFSSNASVVTSPAFWQDGNSANVHPVEHNAALGQRGMSEISSESVIQEFRRVYEQIVSPAIEP